MVSFRKPVDPPIFIGDSKMGGPPAQPLPVIQSLLQPIILKPDIPQTGALLKVEIGNYTKESRNHETATRGPISWIKKRPY